MTTTTIRQYVTTRSTGTVHLMSTHPTADRTLCGQIVGVSTHVWGDETASGSVATCAVCRGLRDGTMSRPIIVSRAVFGVRVTSASVPLDPAVGSQVGEQQRSLVLRDGVPIGYICYVRRRRSQGGSDYGWQPLAGPKRRTLMSKSEAVGCVLAADEAAKRCEHCGAPIVPVSGNAHSDWTHPHLDGVGHVRCADGRHYAEPASS